MPSLSKIVWLIALAKLALHGLSSARGYGYFGDELYYFACATHLDLGYVDHPPLSIWILEAWQSIFGPSLAAIRLLAALFGAGAAVLAAMLARDLGGRGPAQVLTALIVAIAPVNLVVHGFYSMNAVDIVIWLAAFVLVGEALRHRTTGRWAALGVVLGIGLLNKYSVMWFGAGLAVGLLATPHRRALRTPGPWLAGAIAVLLFLPHVYWQIANGWPSLEFVQNATTQKMLPVSPLDLFAQQILVWNPLVLPLWLIGFVALVRQRGEGLGRVFAAIFVTTAAILIANGTSRPNYLALAMPPLIVAGVIALEQFGVRREWRWPLPAAAAGIALVGLALSPMTLPLLAPADLVAYSRFLGLGAPQMERSDVGALDQHFADMFGWEELVDRVAGVVDALGPEERERVVILGASYGEAGAVDFFGPEHGLPSAISPHDSYWLWGPGDADGSVVVIVGGPPERWAPYWNDLEAVAQQDCAYCMPGRSRSKIYLARNPRMSMERIWTALRRFE